MKSAISAPTYSFPMNADLSNNSKTALGRIISILFFGLALHALSAQAVAQTARVLRPAWTQLSELERNLIREKYSVIVADPSDFGLIVDTQGIDQSTPGTNVGAIAGGAIASTAYVQRSMKSSNNYSPGAHLAIGVLGALIGSTTDSAPTSQFQYRYAIRTSDGEIITRDVIQSDPFRHSVGMCLSLSSVSPVPKSMCGQSADEIRTAYITPPTNEAPRSKPAASDSTPNTPVQPQLQEQEQARGEKVICKIKNQFPVEIPRKTCQILEGVEL